MTTPPWVSPDGRWWWDGSRWQPVAIAGGRTEPLAIAAFVCSLAFPVWPLSSIAAVVLGIVSLRQLRAAPGTRGTGLAMAAITVGAVILVLFFLAFALLVWLGVACHNGC